MLFVFCVCHADLPVPCSLVVTCWKKGWSLGSLVIYVFCVLFTFQYGVLGQVWYLIVSIADLCLLPYIVTLPFLKKRSSSYGYKFYAKSH